MTPNLLEILIVIALGTLAGVSFGLITGYITGNQNTAWSLLTRRQKVVNLLLIVVCTAICITVLGWYSLTVATSVR
jgi:hypothetical protein